MQIFSFIFYLGVINIIFSAVWKLLATMVSSLLQDIGLNKEISFFFFKALGYYILVSITAIVTTQHMSSTFPLGAAVYAATGTFVIYATIASNLERNRWRAVMQFERKRLSVMRYDGYLLMASIVLFIATLIKPAIAMLGPHLWILDTIAKIYAIPVLNLIIWIMAFFYMVNILYRGIRATDEVFRVLFGKGRQGKAITDGPREGEYTEYEEVRGEEQDVQEE